MRAEPVPPPRDWEFQLSSPTWPLPWPAFLCPPSVSYIMREAAGYHPPLLAYGPGTVPSLAPLLWLFLFEAKSTFITSLTGAMRSLPQSLQQLEQKRACMLVGAWAGGQRGSSPGLPPTAVGGMPGQRVGICLPSSASKRA